MTKKEAKNEVRIDKWLWAVRLFKTRSIAAEACKKGKIMIAGNVVKASRNVKVGDIIQIKKAPVTYSFKVLALTENRMGAGLVPGFMENVTPQEQLDILELSNYNSFGKRDRGTGRPTKKDRRDMDDYFDLEENNVFDFDFSDNENDEE